MFLLLILLLKTVLMMSELTDMLEEYKYRVNLISYVLSDIQDQIQRNLQKSISYSHVRDYTGVILGVSEEVLLIFGYLQIFLCVLTILRVERAAFYLNFTVIFMCMFIQELPTAIDDYERLAKFVVPLMIVVKYLIFGDKIVRTAENIPGLTSSSQKNKQIIGVSASTLA
ncbi:unnamed protein product [Moneuplotes crassus]|uniref:Uncharacterized protein n=1 Tax=Euplotes crassus TaxID=5936 RepID=A0AAD2D7D9_EUPCR|nr:unnamed protein product [Moneuplotes crassus]